MTRHDDTPGVIAPPLAIYAVPLVVGLLIDRTRPRGPAYLAPSGPLGAVLLGIGAAAAIWAQLTMSRAGTSSLPYTSTAVLVEEGPFHYSRNPMYVAFSLAYVGVSALARATTPLVLLPVVLIVMRHGVIGREERYLERRFGQHYADYAARVRRWL